MDVHEVLSPKPNFQKESTSNYGHRSRSYAFTMDATTKQLHQTELSVGDMPALAIHATQSVNVTDAQSVIDPEAINRFCQIWAGVGRAILARRSKQNG